MLPNSFPISTNYIFSYNLKYIIFFQTNNIMFFVTVFIGAYLDNSIFLLNLINLIAMNNCKHHLWKVFLFKKALQFLLILDYTKPLMEFLLSRFREWKSQHPLTPATAALLPRQKCFESQNRPYYCPGQNTNVKADCIDGYCVCTALVEATSMKLACVSFS